MRLEELGAHAAMVEDAPLSALRGASSLANSVAYYLCGVKPPTSKEAMNMAREARGRGALALVFVEPSRAMRAGTPRGGRGAAAGTSPIKRPGWLLGSEVWKGSGGGKCEACKKRTAAAAARSSPARARRGVCAACANLSAENRLRIPVLRCESSASAAAADDADGSFAQCCVHDLLRRGAEGGLSVRASLSVRPINGELSVAKLLARVQLGFSSAVRCNVRESEVRLNVPDVMSEPGEGEGEAVEMSDGNGRCSPEVMRSLWDQFRAQPGA